MFFGLGHLKDVFDSVTDRWLNNKKNLKCMDAIKSILISLLGFTTTLLGNLLVTASFGVEDELTEIIC